MRWFVWIAVAGLLPSVQGDVPLQRLADLRALTHQQAAAGVPVVVEGTILGLEPSVPFHFFMHDGSAGCFIKTRDGGRPPGMMPGKRVRVEGVSDPLGYYPSVRDARVQVVGDGDYPVPLKPDAGRMFSPELDSAWVEVPAVVTGCESGDDRLTLDVEVHGLAFKAELPIAPGAGERATALLQRPVRMRGVMGTIFNRQWQMTDRHFFVPSVDAITPMVPPAQVGSSPLATVTSLLTGGSGPLSPVRLQGVVTQHDAKGFYLRDGTGSTLVHAAMNDRHPAGTRVEVEGFGAVAPFRPVMRATHVTRLGPERISPLPFPEVAGHLPELHGEWVTIDAEFLGSRSGIQDGILHFRSAGRFFEVMIPSQGAAEGRSLNPGDQVRLAGICEVTTSHALPRPAWADGFRIHLPEKGGVEVLRRASWWTTSRLLAALGLMSGVAALATLTSWLLRRRVLRQMAIISAKLRAETIGEERDRMARELHDTLEQQLSGVALQLDSLGQSMRENPSKAADLLDLARRMLRFTRLEARRSVWDLRSKVLEADGLSAALRASVASPEQGRGPAVEVRVSGVERPLEPGVDFHLLRIAQEAFTNAIKHGSATRVDMTIDYLPSQTRMVIHDNGAGFDPVAAQSSGGPHFGLLGMRERASKLGATLDICSSPGQGCTVTVIVPFKPLP